MSRYSQQYQSGPPPGSAGIYGGYQGGGGFMQRQQRPTMPPGADPQLWQWFNAVDEDGSGAISATELQAALVNGDWNKFDVDTVKLLMTLFDTDRSGTIGFNEFAGLWKYIAEWQNVFRHFDRDRSGSIDQSELTQAMRGFGFDLPPNIMHLMMQKYIGSGVIVPGGPPPSITFDRFLRACVVIRSLKDMFDDADKRSGRRGVIQLNYYQFMEMFLRTP